MDRAARKEEAMSASAPASAAQLTELMKLFCGLSRARVQKLLNNSDLVLLLTRAHLDVVDREGFRALLEHDPLDVYSALLKTPEEGLTLIEHFNRGY